MNKKLKKDLAHFSEFAALPEEEKLALIERLKSSGLPPKDIEFMTGKIRQIMQIITKLHDENATMEDIQAIYGIKTK
jgi:hypothetical protein